MIKSTTFQHQAVKSITVGDSHAVFAPQCGGLLLRWERKGREVVRWPEDADWSRVTKVRGGNPVLFPFIARHFVDGHLGKWKDEAGKVYDLPMHGFGRTSEYEVVETPESDTLHMRIRDTEETRKMYPFRFTFDLIYRLESDRLQVTFRTSNHGDVAMPYYAGHHFYFPVPHGTRNEWEVTIPCKQWVRQDEVGAVQHEPAVGNTYSLGEDALVDRMHELEGRKDLLLVNHDESFRLRFDLTNSEVPWYAVTTWREKADSDFYCVEPWLGLPNAIHHGYGLRRLAPGATESATCTLVDEGK